MPKTLDFTLQPCFQEIFVLGKLKKCFLRKPYGVLGHFPYKWRQNIWFSTNTFYDLKNHLGVAKMRSIRFWKAQSPDFTILSHLSDSLELLKILSDEFWCLYAQNSSFCLKIIVKIHVLVKFHLMYLKNPFVGLPPWWPKGPLLDFFV